MGSGTYPLSADADAIRESIRWRRLTEVYHYAPLSQVPGIVQHGGIHPRAVLRERGILFRDAPQRWSNMREKAEALTDYIAIGVRPPWGMMKDDPECVVFGVHPDVLLRDGTAFMGNWSSRGEIRGLRDVEAHEGITSFNAMFDNHTTKWPSPIPGEVLIKGTIRPEDITALYVRSQEHLARVNNECAMAGVSEQAPYRGVISPPGQYVSGNPPLFPPSMREEDSQ